MRGGGLTRVTVGQLFTLTQDEERQLLELAELEVSLLKRREKGWRVSFVKATTLVNKILWRAVERAQKKPASVETLDP